VFSVTSITISYELDGPGFETRLWARYFLQNHPGQFGPLRFYSVGTGLLSRI